MLLLVLLVVVADVVVRGPPLVATILGCLGSDGSWGRCLVSCLVVDDAIYV